MYRPFMLDSAAQITSCNCSSALVSQSSALRPDLFFAPEQPSFRPPGSEGSQYFSESQNYSSM
ncbi:hypothetical protein K439DRAFT_1643236 [Ramaria rubella]|nr:hypothetical protein K439DRAFT_1643236 [Ramaria rubella]